MPIRFRCAYCNQLMGISRRKAGTVVRCPNCAGQVVVPNQEEAPEDPDSRGAPEVPEAPSPPGGVESKPKLFERSDFDDAFHSAAGGKRPPPQTQSSPLPPALFPPVPTPSPPKELGKAHEPERADFPSQLPSPAIPPGIVLSPALATLLSVALVVALALAFTAGLIVGRFFLQPSRDERPDNRQLAPRSFTVDLTLRARQTSRGA